MKSCSNCSKLAVCSVRTEIASFVEDNWIMLVKLPASSSNVFDEWYALVGERCAQYERSRDDFS